MIDITGLVVRGGCWMCVVGVYLESECVITDVPNNIILYAPNFTYSHGIPTVSDNNTFRIQLNNPCAGK